jgi:hypothetical protein
MTKTTVRKKINNAFWATFAKNYWEKKPGAFKGRDFTLLEIDAQQIFELLLLYSDHCRKTRTIEGLKFYIDGQKQYIDDVLELLPLKHDRSLHGYHQRLSRELSDYCLVCDELMQVSMAHWNLLGEFMRGLYKHTGLPNRFAEIGLYLGNYRKTPFGVHVDGCGVLSIPVAGVKTFRLWTPEFIEKNPDLKEAHSYGNYKKNSSLLTAKPGDITYWPSKYWHIAESDGSFSATWSIGVWVDQPASELLIQTIRPLISRKLKSNAKSSSIHFASPPAENGHIGNLPSVLNESIQTLLNLSKAELHDVFLRRWLETVSKNGFKNAPKPNLQSRLKRQDRLQRKSSQPITWSVLSDRRLCIAANGILIDLPNSEKTISLIENLNLGKTCAVNKVNALEFTCLQTLLQNHAVTKVISRSKV